MTASSSDSKQHALPTTHREKVDMWAADYPFDAPTTRRIATAIEALVRDVATIMTEADDPAGHSHTKSSKKDLVTVYDVRVQQALYEGLSALVPRAGFLGEEENANDTEGKPCFFIVDPIDGTSNFVAGYRHSAISVALVEAKGETAEPLIGVCYNPYLDELFSAIRDEGARLNGAPISISDRAMGDSLVLFGTSPYRRELADQTFRMVKELFLRSRDVRRGGAAVLDLCYIGAGRGELFYEMNLSPWDYAAAALVASEAGAVVTDLDGRPLSFTRPTGMMAGCPDQHAEGMALYREILGGKD